MPKLNDRKARIPTLLNLPPEDRANLESLIDGETIRTLADAASVAFREAAEKRRKKQARTNAKNGRKSDG